MKFEKLYLDLLPDYIPFEFQATKADGTKFDPTGTPTVTIYEEDGADASYSSTQITGSPFNMAKINTKTGNYGVLIDKSLFTAGNVYRVLFEATVDGIDTAKIEYYIAYDFGNNVWDEQLTAATHNIATSAGRRLRTLVGIVIREELAQGSGTGSNQIQLDSGASSVDGAYDPAVVAIVAGTGTGQSRLIYQYDGSTKTATVDRDWKVLPAADSEFIIVANPGREHVNEGLAQSGTASTITLNALASSIDDTYKDQIVYLKSGTGADQTGRVTSYKGSTKVATISPDWVITPDSTTAYVMLPSDSTSDLLSAIAAVAVLVNAIDTSTETKARFDEIKGVGWTDETLKAIKVAVDAISIENFTAIPGSNT